MGSRQISVVSTTPRSVDLEQVLPAAPNPAYAHRLAVGVASEQNTAIHPRPQHRGCSCYVSPDPMWRPPQGDSALWAVIMTAHVTGRPGCHADEWSMRSSWRQRRRDGFSALPPVRREGSADSVTLASIVGNRGQPA